MRFSTFKMFGLQRTCTNLVRQAVLHSFRVRSIESGYEWKHGQIGQAARDGAAIICCVRDPYAWLWAMYRFARNVPDLNGCPHFRSGWSFGEFIAGPHYEWERPIDRWNAMNAHYSQWVERNPNQGVLIRSENLMGIESQTAAIGAVGRHFGWIGEPVSFDRRVQHATDRLGESMNFDYYLDRRYLEEYSPDLLARVTAGLDFRLIERLGYGAVWPPSAKAAT